jgi:hypothetical protein
VPEGQLLPAVGRVIDGIQVEGQVTRRALEGGDELVEEDVTQPLEGGDGDGLLEAGQGGLAGQFGLVGGAAGEELEDGVGAEGVVVVLVRVAGQDAVDPRADHLQEGVRGEAGVARVVQGVGDGPGQADTLVERADGEQAGVPGERAWRRLDDKRGDEKVVDLWPGRR